MTNTNPNAPAYRWLLFFWLCNLLGVIFNLIDGGDSPLTVCSILAVVAAIAQFYPFYQLSKLSDRLHRAFTINVISVCATVIGLIAVLAAPTIHPPYTSTWILVVMSLVAVAGAVCMYVSQFFLYAGLDTLRAERGYDYPSRLIRLCFFVPLTCAIAAVFLNDTLKNSVLLLAQFFALIVLGIFVRAAWKAEKDTANS